MTVDTLEKQPARQRAFMLAEARLKHDPATTQARQAERERVLRLAEMRRQRGDQGARSAQLVRTELATRRKLLDLLEEEPSSAPQLAEQTGMQTHEVLWYLAAMRKRGLIEEAGTDDMGDYFLYTLSTEARV